MGDAGTRALQTNAAHRFVKAGAIFSLVDGIGSGADHFHTELGQHAVFFQIQRAVQRSLATHGGQDGVGRSFLMISRTTSQVMGSM